MNPRSIPSLNPPRAPRARWLLAALLVGALTGCTPQVEAPPPQAQEGDGGTAQALAAPLTPVIRALGPEGGVPTEVVLEFPRPVTASPHDEVRPGTVLTLSPEVGGTLSFRSPSTLVFTPRPGLAYGTSYTVTLSALELDKGVVRPPEAHAWSHTFTTPAFAFRHLAPRQEELGKGVVEVDLVFTGPVELKAVQRRASFTVEGQPLTDVKLRTGDAEGRTVTATLRGAGLKPGAVVRLVLGAGVTALGQGRLAALAAQDSFELQGGRRMDIVGAYLREGATGYYLDIRCHEVDSGAPRSREEPDWDWSSNEGPRCHLEEEVAASALHFTPEVKFSVSPTRWGFRILGDFSRGSYTLRLDEGATSPSGGRLLSPFEHTFSVAARGSQLGFSSTGRYLPRSAWRNLPLHHLNVDQVELSVRNVPPENLVFWMGDDERETADERTSNLLVRTTLALDSPQDVLATTYVDVGSLVPAGTRGLMEVTASTEYGVGAASRILLTDLSLVAKRGLAEGEEAREEVWVWALGLESPEPLAGVEVSLVKRSGQVVARCTTAGEEGCRLKVPEPGVDESPPFALLARRGREVTYLKYSELKTDLSLSDVQGEPYRGGEVRPYRASLYTDRGVYRPGETAHVVGVVREEDGRAPPEGLPVEVQVVDPRERDFKRVLLKTNAAGMVALDVPFEAYQDTGAYQVSLNVAGEAVASGALNVEEFVPERMKVSARLEKAGYLQGEEVPVGVEAAYLFGGSAEGSPVALTCRLEPALFRPKEHGQYTYGVWRESRSAVGAAVLGEVSGELNEKGQVLLSCPAQREAGGFEGAARLVAQASVFEAGSGRSTVGESSVLVHPAPWYVGLQTSAAKVMAGQPFTVSGVLVDWQGALYTKKVEPLEVEYYRLEEEYGSSSSEGEERYQRHLRPVREGKTVVPAQGGRFSLRVTPAEASAGYLVRVKAGAARTDLQLEGEAPAYWWDEDTERRVDQTPRPLRATALAVELPHAGRVGEPLTVKVKAPYRGRMLFTVETDRVLDSGWVEARPGEVTWTFTPKVFAPNVYVSAFLVKDPHLESAEAFMPDRAFGVASVALEPVEYTQQVTLSVPREVRSRDTLTVDVELGAVEAGTFATVAVVDEGVLSLTRFPSPDPLMELMTRRALAVETYETLGWTLLARPAGNSRSTGGDEDSGAAGRVQPVKPVALWSGVLPVPASGRLRVPFQLPQYRGAVRVMAVTVGPRRIGRASAQVRVKDPLVLQTTLPRFLSQGDELQIPVFVTNLSGKAQEVKVRLSAEDLPVPGLTMPVAVESPLKLLGRSEGRVKLENGKAATLVFQAKAVKAVGAARLKVTAEGGGHTSVEQLDVPFLPAGPRERRVERVELAAGTLELGPKLQGWVPTSERSTFWVTANPYAESFQHLSYLVRYPYGCIEQTTSSTRPLLYVSELIDSVDPALTAQGKVEDMVQSGVKRVLSMQTPSGGFGYWPGSLEPVAWGTAYATHMLLDARKLNYPVPQDRVDEALAWMSQQVTRNEGGGTGGSHEEEAEAYMHYVLALGGKGHKARAQKLLESLPARQGLSEGMRAEQEYMLKAALYVAGDRRYEKDLRAPDLSPVKDERSNGWSFYSDRRRRGFMLSTFQDLFGGDAAGEPLARQVAEALKDVDSAHYTTQELVWGVTGLGKRVAGAASKFTPPVLVADGKEVAPRNGLSRRSSDRTWALVRASERQGLSLKVAEKGEGKLFLVLASDGVRAEAKYRTGGEGLKLSRRYRKLDGTELDVKGSAVGLAELVYVEVSLTNTTGERIQNIALVDRLPAGWEIENARLGRGGGVSWATPDEQWAADYVNLRDDRVEVFGALGAGETKKVVYAVRAVTAGHYTLPPVEAEAMYEPRIWAREAGATVEVSSPWKDFLL
jgi:hypothetical protein